MAEGENPVEHAGKGIQGFLERETAGLPNWVWLLIVGAGIGVAYILPRFVSTSNGAPTSNAGATQTGAVDTGTQQSQTDMLSAFSNYLNTLTQQGATTLADLQSIQKQLAAPAPKRPSNPTPAPPPPGFGQLPPRIPGPPGTHQPIDKQPLQRSVTVATWPNNGSTLSQIAKANGTTVAHLQQLNPSIKDPNKISAGQQIRVR